MKSINYVSSPVNTPLLGEMSVPGDKSISHRAIMFGAMAKGTTTIHGFLDGEDCLRTLQAFQQMGVAIEGPNQYQVTVHGAGKYGLKASQTTINCGNSGTTMRLLTGILAAQNFDSELTGDESLCKRPMERVSQPLRSMGAEITTHEGRPPLRIKGRKKLQGISYEMPIASAQVKSCLLLAGMYAEGSTTVIESAITRDHTERMLTTFSYPWQQLENGVCIDGSGELIATDVTVPGDISSAAFFLVAASITPHSKVLIRNVGMNPTRTGVIQILQKMGGNITIRNERAYGGEPVADVFVTYAPLKGIEIPLDLVALAIDEFPVLFIAAASAQGKTILRGAHELRLKESDRIGAMVEGLQTVGIHAEALEDGAIIEGGKMSGGVINSHHDHRIAMAFAIAGAVASHPITILHCNNVMTSFPTFVKTANTIKMSVQEIYDSKF